LIPRDYWATVTATVFWERPHCETNRLVTETPSLQHSLRESYPIVTATAS
jgi:hypothetical protein